MNERDKALAHFGIPGMKWGIRRAAKGAGDWAKAAGKMTKNGITNPYLAERANRESIQSEKKFGTRFRRAAFVQSTKEIQDANARFDKLKSEKPSLHKRASDMIASGKKKVDSLSENQKTGLKLVAIAAGTVASTYVAAKFSDALVAKLVKASYDQSIMDIANTMIPLIKR